jgi:diacylglycerol kinase family enzyme
VHILVVNNLASGSGDAGLFTFVRELSRNGCEVTIRPMSEETPLPTALRDARDFDRVVAAGGDGTASGVAYALRGTGVPIALYPSGSANLLALNLKLPVTPGELAEVAMNGVPCATDMGEITCLVEGCEHRYGFVNAAGAGFDATIMEGARDLKPMLGMGAYFVGAMQKLQPTVAQFRIELDGEPFEREGIAVVLVNFAKIMFDLTLAHDSSAHDGQLDVMVIRTKYVPGLVPAVWAAVLDRIGGDHPGRSESLEIMRGSRVRVESEPELPMQYDGEVLDCRTPFEGRVLEGAATLVVPPTYLPQE